MRIAFLTSLGHSEKKEKTVSYGRSDNGDGAKRCEQEKQLSPSLFVFSLLSRRAALQLCERVEQASRVLFSWPTRPPSALANETFLELHNCSVHS